MRKNCLNSGRLLLLYATYLEEEQYNNSNVEGGRWWGTNTITSKKGGNVKCVHITCKSNTVVHHKKLETPLECVFK